MLAKVQPDIIAKNYAKFKGDETNRLELERIRAQLSIERSTFVPHWQEIGRFIHPRRTRFYTTDTDRGNRRNMSIIDSTATQASDTLMAGMMSSFTSPARPWFRITTMDPDLAKFGTVQEWLYDVTWRMSEVFLRSNLYASLQTIYGDMGDFATAALFLEEDFERVIQTYPFVIGSYYLIPDSKLNICGFMRDFRLTVRQIVEQFGTTQGSSDIDWTNISELVKGLWNSGNTEAWLECTQAVIPNPKWDPGSPLSDRKRYLSTYYERGAMGSNYILANTDLIKILSRKGYDKLRFMAPRWQIQGEDIYGTMCPGMNALGDIQQLQTMEKRGAQALEKSINPPMVGPSSLKTQKTSVLPGDITYVDKMEGQQGYQPAYQIQPNFQQLNLEKETIRQRIKKAYHEDLWLVISNLNKGNVTAEEVRALKEEKLQEVGPVVDRINQDLADPLIEMVFDIMGKQGLLPPTPQELRNRPLRIEYVSIMHQAQKALGAASIERFWGFAMQVKQADPENPASIDKVNTDKLLDHYGVAVTVAPGIVRDDKEVADIRNQRAKQQAQQQKMAALQQASETAKNLASAPTGDEPNALTDLIQSGQAGNLQPA